MEEEGWEEENGSSMYHFSGMTRLTLAVNEQFLDEASYRRRDSSLYREALKIVRLIDIYHVVVLIT